MTKSISLTTQAHQYIQRHLSPGELAIDATVGNGNDTLFLAKQVKSDGLVFGFDLQQAAIEATKTKLSDEEFDDNVRLFHCSHSEMQQQIDHQFHGQIKVIMFNLGYLPGSDKSVITLTSSTLSALNQAITLLTSKGIITIAAYPGHSGGDSETNEVTQWFEQLDAKKFNCELIYSSNKSTAPRLFIIHKS